MLALTAFATTEERVREAGFDAYLAKPADPPSLVRAIVALASEPERPSCDSFAASGTNCPIVVLSLGARADGSSSAAAAWRVLGRLVYVWTGSLG